MLLQNKALELGLTGWVRNRRDGRVEVTAEGYEEHLQQFLSWLHSGEEQWKMWSMMLTRLSGAMVMTMALESAV